MGIGELIWGLSGPIWGQSVSIWNVGGLMLGLVGPL